MKSLQQHLNEGTTEKKELTLENFKKDLKTAFAQKIAHNNKVWDDKVRTPEQLKSKKPRGYHEAWDHALNMYKKAPFYKEEKLKQLNSYKETIEDRIPKIKEELKPGYHSYTNYSNRETYKAAKRILKSVEKQISKLNQSN